ncbi:MAG: hypothetical protein HZB55_16630 [Deltaproteobacteria bacterium]|nr:hypothetical protein [Deltaproteobacteria bacterium]
MKTVGIVVVLVGLLGLSWLLLRDVQTVTAEHGGKAVVEPIQRAKDAVDVVNQSQKAMQDRVDAIDR